MSISGIASTLFSQFDTTAAQAKFQHIKQGFQQLGQDLQSGNLTQAQSDFAALQQNLPGGQQAVSASTPTTSTATSPLTQAVAQLAQDLKSGNLAAAQSDVAADELYGHLRAIRQPEGVCELHEGFLGHREPLHLLP